MAQGMGSAKSSAEKGVEDMGTEGREGSQTLHTRASEATSGNSAKGVAGGVPLRQVGRRLTGVGCSRLREGGGGRGREGGEAHLQH